MQTSGTREPLYETVRKLQLILAGAFSGTTFVEFRGCSFIRECPELGGAK
ncbi:hypothetical protein DOT_2768 [Desulfosporosinus sp. OT]|nr:hypothetical protein DOT_2768 [Desulfosporosinus sp. OT]